MMREARYESLRNDPVPIKVRIVVDICDEWSTAIALVAAAASRYFAARQGASKTGESRVPRNRHVGRPLEVAYAM